MRDAAYGRHRIVRRLGVALIADRGELRKAAGSIELEVGGTGPAGSGGPSPEAAGEGRHGASGP